MTFLFRTTGNHLSFLVLLLGILLHGSAWVSGVPIPETPIESLTLPAQWLHSIFPTNPVTNMVWAFVVMMLIVLVYQSMVHLFELLPNDNWAAAQALVFSTALFPQQHFLSIPLLSLLFCLFSFYRAMTWYRSEMANQGLFEAALLMGLSIQLFPQTALLMVWLFAAQSVLRVFSFRELLIIISGLGLPFYFLGMAYFIQGNLEGYLTAWGQALFPMWWIPQLDDLTIWGAPAVMLLFTLAGLIDFSTYRNKLMLKIRKMHTVMFWWLMLGLLVFVISGQLSDAGIWIIIIPLSTYAGVFLSRHPYPWIKEVMAWLICGFILYHQWSTLLQ